MTAIVTDPPVKRTTEETAALLIAFYEEECAILGIPPYDSPAERASLTALAQPVPF